jgi:ribosomal protein uL22
MAAGAAAACQAGAAGGRGLAAISSRQAWWRPHGRPCSAVQARGSDLRVHFKNTRESAFALRKMDLNKAKRYLEDVIARKRCIPFRRFTGCIGRTAQAKNENAPAGQGRWPVKSCEFLLNLLKNAESNAEVRQPGCRRAVLDARRGARARIGGGNARSHRGARSMARDAGGAAQAPGCFPRPHPGRQWRSWAPGGALVQHRDRTGTARAGQLHPCTWATQRAAGLGSGGGSAGEGSAPAHPAHTAAALNPTPPASHLPLQTKGLDTDSLYISHIQVCGPGQPSRDRGSRLLHAAPTQQPTRPRGGGGGSPQPPPPSLGAWRRSTRRCSSAAARTVPTVASTPT